MTRAVVWSTDALDDLADAFDFVAETNPAYALALVDRIEAAGNRLGAHATGRPGRVAHTYEKSLPELRYIVAYKVDDRAGVLTILHVVHSRQYWPAGGWPE